MKIGIDLDGVVFDSEKEFRVYSELYDMLELKQNSKVNNKEIRFEGRFDWTEKEAMAFLGKYHKKIVQESNYMPGAQMILRMLKEEKNELIVITARGGMNKDIITYTEQRLKQDNMDIFDKYYYAIGDKAQVCENEKIDIMIEDSCQNCKDIANKKIKTIYLKDAPCYELEESPYIKTLYNWGEIYRYIKEIL